MTPARCTLPSDSISHPSNPISATAIVGTNGWPAVVTPNPRPYFARKYVIERAFGILLLVLLSPLIVLLCILVRCCSRGSGLYVQERVGHLGRIYRIYKIRTMRQDAEEGGVAVWCAKRDPRVTRIGKFLRKSHLDELPQLINVARGEMTLIGPRPERPEFVQKLSLQIKEYNQRLSVMPGITGLAQINLPPDETVEDARRKQILDLLYIAEGGPWLDFRMLIATAMRMVGIRGELVMRSMGLCRMSHVKNIHKLEGSSVLEAKRTFNDVELALVGELSHIQSQSAPTSSTLRHPR